MPAGLARAAGLVSSDAPAHAASQPFCVVALLEVANGVRENADGGRIIVAPSGEHVAIRMLLALSAAEAQTGIHVGLFDHEHVEAALRAAGSTLRLEPRGVARQQSAT